MRSKTGAIAILFLFFLLFPFGNQTCIAQEHKQPFLEIILQLQELFDVRFSYSGKEIETLMVEKPDYTNTLPKILDQLTKNTGLQFKNINERYIAITTSEDKYSNICGILFNAETLFPLEGATIQVLGSNKATISNLDGKFSAENVQQNATIKISYVGFETLITTADALQATSPCTTLALKPLISELQDIVLQSIFSRGINKTKDGAITLQVESFGDLPGLTEPDVLLMVQALPGISSVDETVSNINIRGGTTDENLILWDDVRMYQNGHFFGLISAFNPYLTKQVTVYKNGTNARYGESVSGVIAMHSASEIPEKTNGGIQLNLVNMGAFGEIAVNEKLGIFVSGRRSINDFVQTPTYTQFFNRMFQNTKITNLENVIESGSLDAQEDFSFYDLSLKALYKPSDTDTFQFNFLNIDNDLNFTETYSTENTENSKTSELDQNSIAGGFAWKRNWRENLSTNAMVYGTYYFLNASNLDVFSNQQIIQNNEVLETGVKLDANLTWINNNTFSAGYQFTETGISNTQDINLPRFRSFIKEVLRNHSVFISNSFNFPATRTSLTAGIRGNYFPKFNRFLVEPRINVHQKLGNGFAVEAAAELKSQSVT
ncbi:MAG: TonB-dependent receptor, partial [Flavobacteriales bacterium]|nr:TonB-dependent receptor [Flavobacteriales bacterium]